MKLFPHQLKNRRQQKNISFGSVLAGDAAPTALDGDDVIGVSAAGGEKGMEVVRQVYPKLGMTPGLLLAPGWSHIPDVGIVLAAKCEEINGYFTCECLIDIDSTADGCTALLPQVRQPLTLMAVVTPKLFTALPCT